MCDASENILKYVWRYHLMFLENDWNEQGENVLNAQAMLAIPIGCNVYGLRYVSWSQIQIWKILPFICLYFDFQPFKVLKNTFAIKTSDIKRVEHKISEIRITVKIVFVAGLGMKT